MDTPFGSVHYSEDCVANILSYSQVKSTAYSCYQRPDEDIFRVQMTHDSSEYMFERKLRIYLCYGMGSHIGFQAYFACYGTLLFYFFYTFISVLVLYIYITDHLAVYLYSRKN